MKQHFEAMRKAGLSLAFFAFISVLLVAITDQGKKCHRLFGINHEYGRSHD